MPPTTRALQPASRQPGVELFVYGRRGLGGGTAPTRYPARQTREAGEAVARRHGLDPARTVFAQQRPDSIDAGVFHNDVIAVGEGTFLLCHERAFVDQPAVLDALRTAVGGAFTAVVITDDELPLADAVGTYLFNSQLLAVSRRAPAARRAGRMPRASERRRTLLDRLVDGSSPIADVLTFDLRQSMRNGGGPACLRLRVPLTDDDRRTIAANVFLDADLDAALDGWIRRHYRDRLAPADLRDPALLDESRRALDELTGLLKLPSIYPFQLRGDRTDAFHGPAAGLSYRPYCSQQNGVKKERQMNRWTIAAVGVIAFALAGCETVNGPQAVANADEQRGECKVVGITSGTQIMRSKIRATSIAATSGKPKGRSKPGALG